MRQGSSFLIGLVIVVVVGVGAWFGAQAFLVPVLDEPAMQRLISPIAGAAIHELTNGSAHGGSMDGDRYTSESEGFSVVAPGMPEVATNSTTVAGVTISQVTAVWQTPTGGYIIGTADLSDYRLNGDDVLDGAVAGMVSSTSGATLRSSEKSTFLGETSENGEPPGNSSAIRAWIAANGAGGTSS